eukprot:scaffold3090_cov75-Skeletonema_dohrnii-CCMP3373.AAC.5
MTLEATLLRHGSRMLLTSKRRPLINGSTKSCVSWTRFAAPSLTTSTHHRFNSNSSNNNNNIVGNLPTLHHHYSHHDANKNNNHRRSIHSSNITNL